MTGPDNAHLPGRYPHRLSSPASRYAELCVTSNFTFLTGASHPEELITRAAELGLSAVAITDRNSLAGVVRAYSALKELGRNVDTTDRGPCPPLSVLPRLIVGCRLVLRDSPVDWIALPRDRAAYQRLSRLLTRGKRRAEKGGCHIDLRDLQQGGEGLILIALPQQGLTGPAPHHIASLRRRYPGQVFLGAAPRYDGSDQDWFTACARAALRLSTPMVAVGDVLMHHGNRRRLADVLTCMRHNITIDRIGTRALPNAERRLKPPADMARLYRNHPAALRRTVEIAGKCSFCLSELSYDYPDETAGTEAPQVRLTRLAFDGLKQRCPDGVPDRYDAMARKELAMIEDLGFAAYFLTVHDIMTYARSIGILCQGRGSAANSILCWALGITDVSPEQIAMVFERFVSKYRGEPPDIDVDFEHERREEVIQHIYEKYGRHRAGLCATVIHFRSRAAIREVGKVMGLSQDVTAGLSGQIWGQSGKPPDSGRMRELGLDLGDRRLTQTVQLIRDIIGFPRHLSQHVGGFIITEGRLDELCPIENAAMEDRTVIEWDKDDIDALGILKVDVLSLGMLSCLRRCFDLLRHHEGQSLSIDAVPQEDAATYDMLGRADAVGVFQVESRAQMNFLPRMRPRTFYDLVIEVAIIRPGPIQGDMVHPYINRRQGREQVSFPSPELKNVLGKTLGVPLFQEQAMQIAVVAAGFSPEEADQLRRSLATFRRMGTISSFRDRFVNGMLARGYTPEFAAKCFGQIEGFGEYGFPESHAAAFAMLAYVSAWLKCHHPAIFACALLNSQPMGFYAPAQIVRDAREHQVDIRPICVNSSGWDNSLERCPDGQLALRLGFRQIKGFREEDAGWIVAARGNGYPDPESLWLRAGLRPAVLERLAEADAFAAMGLTRRDALWQVKTIRAPAPLPLFSDPIDGESVREPQVDLPQMHLGEEVVEDYVATRLSLKAHPMELIRPDLPGLVLHCDLTSAPLQGCSVCGLVITRQRPGTASGVIFLTLEDETGVSNVIVWPKVYECYRSIVMGGRLLKVTGQLQREGIVTHLIARHISDESHRLTALGHPLAAEIGTTHPQADDAPRPTSRPLQSRNTARHPREQAKRLFPSRDFH
ncbi:Error-prone DNA polymerase [Thalassovita gelatinovora]|uniref:Error-prone DNA polymerase n=1 Tax=Thalassovita gelatinovora TaxID=53501 RepID=A0A0P1FHX3_THAGE|nr:error-prone DNA polymerase [Thalassovita gelatinovora]QIZ81961.1 error-prone DNA polymerase [Thalassovita gelatinovora]CUH67366.1 Error-prone DNA polymerase [Thalassovita gelatinovora]SEP75454.1 error-prone DNA polymerase, DnaE-like [Thalassovita gelatinovora]